MYGNDSAATTAYASTRDTTQHRVHPYVPTDCYEQTTDPYTHRDDEYEVTPT